MLQVTLLGSAVALLAMPLAAAGPEGPVCPGEVGPSFAVTGLEAAALDGVAPAADAVAGTGLEGTPEPQPLFGPIGPIEPPLCGNVVCPVGTRCCNPLCSACTPPGVECTLGDCGHGPTS
jgi:hypothetical protein